MILVHQRFFLFVLRLINSLKFPVMKHLSAFTPWEFIYDVRQKFKTSYTNFTTQTEAAEGTVQ